MIRKLNSVDVRKICDPASLGFESTETLQAPSAIIGQGRALKALQFGLQIQNSGFNIYAAGLPGTGKMTAITAFVEGVAKDKETPPDWCYVHNFDDPYRPKALKLKAGQAVQFQRDMRRLIEMAQTDIKKAFDSEDYGKRREATARAFNENRERLFSQLNQLAHDNGFAIQMSSMGILDHKLTVCVNTAGCPAGFADSGRAAVDLWNAMNLTWVFEWKGTDCSGTPDIVIGCKNLPIGQLGVAKSHYIPGTATVDHVDILIKSNALWGWCGEMFEIVSVIAHELGPAMRLKDVAKTKQHRCMRCEQLSAGHSRKPSPEDSTEAVASDTAKAITTKIIPPDKEKQSGAGGASR